MTQPDYIFPKYHSPEGIHMSEFVVSVLSQACPDNWAKLFEHYHHYGQSVEPEHHIFKFKGFDSVVGFTEGLRYIEVRFSDAYKANPVEACRLIDDDEWQAIVRRKKAESSNPFWTLF